VTPDQVKAIQDSFAKVAPISEQAAALFYGRLFEIAPAVKPLFRSDMKEQGRKLMATLAVVVNGLSNLESILPAASALAKRHVAYGAKAADYEPVGERCCGRLNAASAPNGRRSSRPPGALPTGCSQNS
jgi:hemoglobin-like flavoprotein